VKIVYNSFHGRYSDSPRSVFDKLADRSDIEHVWLAHPEHLAGFPAGTPTVSVDTDAAVEALETADLVIANTHTEVEWTKGPGTTYVQVWHGIPLKRIHRDVLWAPEGRLDRLDRDVAKWDLLLSPNEDSTPRLRQAFRYDGEVLDCGYPRNDVLSNPDRDEHRARIRKELGLDEDVTVVLYAPTWRDDENFQPGTPTVPLALDLAGLSDRLGRKHVVLTRLHPLMVGRSPVPSSATVRDVSTYPDVSDLYLAADVLVTDYSSAMFDFTLTGRPIVFFAYDLDRFRDSVRGFYFDLLPVAPGPVVSTASELASTLLRLPEVAEESAARYEAFRRRYCPLEDGRSTERLLQHLGL
jgi:CDP-glycerol glycerophosphotransferase